MPLASLPNTYARQARLCRRSRDRWKQRCAAKQNDIRYLRVRVRDLQASRDRWKQQALHATGQPPAPPPPESGLGEALAGRHA
jgi:hypothetical protein